MIAKDKPVLAIGEAMVELALSAMASSNGDLPETLSTPLGSWRRS